MLTVVGSYLSPYVRKVLASLAFKGIDYEIDPIVPFFGNDAFTAVSPVRRIPVLIDGALSVPDSNVICAYLEDRYPEPALYPVDVATRARARALEAFAGTRMGEVFIWRYFNELVIRRHVWGEATDERVVAHSRDVEIPEICGYLESLAPAGGFLFGGLGIADIAIAVFFRNVELTRTTLDLAAFPRTARLIADTLAHPCLADLRKFEELSARTPIPDQRAALAAAGAPVSRQTFFTDKPRRGVLSI